MNFLPVAWKTPFTSSSSQIDELQSQLRRLDMPRREDSELVKALKVIETQQKLITALLEERERLHHRIQQLAPSSSSSYSSSYSTPSSSSYSSSSYSTPSSYSSSYSSSFFRSSPKLTAISVRLSHSLGDGISSVREMVFSQLSSLLSQAPHHIQLNQASEGREVGSVDFGLLLWRVGHSRVDLREVLEALSNLEAQGTSKGKVVVFLHFSSLNQTKKSEHHVMEGLNGKVLGVIDLVYEDMDRFNGTISQNAEGLQTLVNLLSSHSQTG